jgi:hypothetical protein
LHLSFVLIFVQAERQAKGAGVVGHGAVGGSSRMKGRLQCAAAFAGAAGDGSSDNVPELISGSIDGRSEDGKSVETLQRGNSSSASSAAATDEDCSGDGACPGHNRHRFSVLK